MISSILTNKKDKLEKNINTLIKGLYTTVKQAKDKITNEEYTMKIHEKIQLKGI